MARSVILIFFSLSVELLVIKCFIFCNNNCMSGVSSFVIVILRDLYLRIYVKITDKLTLLMSHHSFMLSILFSRLDFITISIMSFLSFPNFSYSSFDELLPMLLNSCLTSSFVKS